MDVAHGGEVSSRAMVLQRKTGRPVPFEISEQTRTAIADWVEKRRLPPYQYLFPSCIRPEGHLSTRQHLRWVKTRVARIGLEPNAYGTHSLRRTKATLIRRRTKNLRAVQLLLGHRKLEITVRYLGIEVEDALEISEGTDSSPKSGVGAVAKTGCFRPTLDIRHGALGFRTRKRRGSLQVLRDMTLRSAARMGDIFNKISHLFDPRVSLARFLLLLQGKPRSQLTCPSRDVQTRE